ncbi:uncharacterized protein LOC127080808 [Lathyrus oleraceus]|uniref:uncharacterized protein LOC127080808 n=1 Tax=Pisum sativum TaxID=3888 RepID=UPI0021CE1B4B|nr:uncharacterized protein LOC127080808 [Pisum sativum]
MDFNCTSYIGEAARRKKDAEDLAARAAILSILDNSDSGIMLVQMIKAKAMLFNSVQLKTLLPTCDNAIVSPIEKTALSCELVQGLKDENKGIADPAGNDNINKGIADPAGNDNINKGIADPAGNDNIFLWG